MAFSARERNDAYAKEIHCTVLTFILYLLAAHTAPWVILFGIDNSARVLGFPLHYFVALFLGWFGVLAVAIWWNRWADRLEAEITSGADDPPQSSGDARGARP